MHKIRMSVTLLLCVAFALCTTRGAYARSIEVDWTPDGVRPYRDYR